MSLAGPKEQLPTKPCRKCGVGMISSLETVLDPAVKKLAGDLASIMVPAAGKLRWKCLECGHSETDTEFWNG
jgi:formate dehydrogenase maturation protein FdhE